MDRHGRVREIAVPSGMFFEGLRVRYIRPGDLDGGDDFIGCHDGLT